MKKFIAILGFICIGMLFFAWEAIPSEAQSAPNTVVIYQTGTGAFISWNGSPDSSIEYEIERSSDGGNSWTQLQSQRAENASNHYLRDDSALCNTDYLYRVRAHRLTDNAYSVYSNIVSIVATPCAAPLSDEICSFSPFLPASIDYLSSMLLSGNGSRAFLSYSHQAQNWLEIYDMSTSALIQTVQAVVPADVSEDGSRFAYIETNTLNNYRQLKIWTNGSVETIAEMAWLGSASMSSDGNKIAFLAQNANGGRQLFLWEEGFGYNAITLGNNFPEMARISGDGNTIVTYIYNTPNYFERFYRWDAVNGLVSLGELPIPPEVWYSGEEIGDISINHDGSSIGMSLKFTEGFNPDTNLFFTWRETEGAVLLQQIPDYWVQGERQLFIPSSWSADGNRVLFLTDDDITGKNPDLSLEYFFSDGGTIRQVTTNAEFGYSLRSVAMSNDGTKILAVTSLPAPIDTATHALSDFQLVLGTCEAASTGTPLNAVTDLSALGIPGNEIELSWTDSNSDESGYILEVFNWGYWMAEAELPANTTSYTYIDAYVENNCGYPYQFRIRSYRSSDGVYSRLSNVATGYVPDCEELLPPFNMYTTNTADGSIRIDWEDINATETKYIIERVVGSGYGLSSGSSTGGTSSVMGASEPLSLSRGAGTSDGELMWGDESAGTWYVLGEVPANSTSYLDDTVLCGTYYSYRVRAYRESDDSYSSDEFYYATNSTACSGFAPRNLHVAESSAASISLEWEDIATSETGYYVDRSPKGLSDWLVIGQLPANSTSYLDTGLLCETGYRYRVRAYRSSDYEYTGTTTLETAVTAACPTEGAPSNLLVTNTSTTAINLSWTDTTSDETGFVLERQNGNATNYTWTAVASLAANSTSYSDSSGLGCSYGYRYRIRAERAGNRTAPSNIVIGYLQCPAPNAASNLILSTYSSSSISFRWTRNGVYSGQFIERSSDGGANWTQLPRLGETASTFDNTGLDCESTYHYRIRAYREYDDSYSAYSPVLTASTLICPSFSTPSNFVSTGNSLTSIALSWQDNTSDETGFGLEISTDNVNWSLVAMVSANGTSYNVTGLTCVRDYYFRIRAAKGSLYSAYTPALLATAGDCPPLLAPSNLTISTSSSYALGLSWTDNEGDETSYRLERSLDGLSWTEIAQLAANTTTYQDTALNCNTGYHYRVRVYRSYDESYSEYSNSASGTTTNCLLGSSLDLSITETTATSVSLSWPDNAIDETAFRLERSINNGTSWTEIAQPAANSTSYTHSGMVCDKAYQYRIRAYRSGDNSFSAYSNVVTLSCPAPTAPINLVASTGTSGGRIVLTYTDTSNSETGFYIETLDVDGRWIHNTASANSSSYTVDFLRCGTSYTFRMKAYRSDGTFSAYTAEVSATTKACTLNAPTGLTITASTSSSLSLIWADTNTTESGYYLDRSLNGATWTQLATLGVDASAYEDTGLSCGAYFYRLRAYRMSDFSTTLYSNIAIGMVDCPAMTSPYNLSVSSSNYIATFNWLDTNDTESGFQLEESSDGGALWANVAQVAPNIYTVNRTMQACGTTYQYRLRAFRNGDGGYSQYSNVVEVQSPVCAPSTPSNLTITDNSGGNITLNWVDNSADETSYRIERSTDSGWNFTEVAQLSANSTSYNDTGVVCSQYRYRVRTHRSQDHVYSSYSNIAFIPCAPSPAPSNLIQTGSTSTTVVISWTDNASDESLSYVERSSDGGVNWVYATSLGANYTTYTQFTLTCNTPYQFRVRVFRNNDGVYSAYSNVLTATTAPCPPSNLTITDNSGGNATLNWLDNANNELSYRVERSTDSGSTWSEIASLAADSTSYNDTGVLCSFYRYRVRAVSATPMYSNYSNVVMIPCPPPAAPTNLIQTESTSSSITMTWTDNASDETAYYVERSTNGVSWSFVGNLGANVTSYTNSSLTCNTAYQYRVRAYRSTNNTYSSYSNVLVATISACPPLAPSGLSLTDNSGGNITLNWVDNATDETAYRVERSTDSGTSWAELADIAANSTSYSDTGVVCIEYRYRLRAYRAGDNEYSAYSETVLLPCPAPAAPTNLVQTSMTNTSFGLAWTDNSTDETSFQLERSVDGGLTFPSGYMASANQTSSSIIQQPCSLRQDYRIRAHRLADGVSSAYSNVLTARTLPCAPSSLTITDNLGGNITLNWLDNASDESGYRVERTTNNGQTWTEIAQLPTGSITHTDTGVICSVYAYRVRAYREVDNKYSDYTSAVYLPCPAPAAPTNLVLSGSTSSSITISWTDNATDETSYRVERSTNGGSTWVVWSSPAANITSYTNSSLSCGTSYQYRVRAYRSSDAVYSAYSNVLTASTLACPPTAPSSLTITDNSGGNISLNWLDNASNESGYRVERSTNAGSSWTEIAQLAAGSTTYSDTGVICSQYRYRVRAVAGTNVFSSYSNTAYITNCPVPAAPSNLRTTSVGSAWLGFAWNDNSNDESHFMIERSTDGGTSWVLINTLNANTTSHTHGVSCSTTYQYRMRAYRSSDAKYSAYSNTISFTTLACFNAPTNLMSPSNTSTSISLSWTDTNTDESSYRLERSSNGGTSWTEIAQLSPNTSSYVDSGRSCNTSYWYRVRGYRFADNLYTSYSNTLQISTNVCVTLNPPRNYSLSSRTYSSLNFSWTESSVNETGYEIERSLDGTNWQIIASLPANSTSYSDNNLECQTIYRYRARALHLGNGSYSLYSFTSYTTGTCPPIVASILSSTGSTANSIGLSWTIDARSTSYTLSYSQGGVWRNLGTFSSAVTSYSHSGLACGQSYQYRIQTYRRNDNGTLYSANFNASTSACPALTAPAAPVVANADVAIVSLQIPAMPASATSMSLERSTDGVNWFGLGLASGNYLDTTVVCDTSYQYRLVAYRASDGQYSSASPVAFATTLACPEAGSNLVGVYRQGQWTIADSSNTTNPISSFNFGDAQWQPIVGDWDGDGLDGIGLYRNGEFILRNSVAGTVEESRINFGDGTAGWMPVAGDWNGDGTDTIGLYKDGLFIISDDNINPNYRFNFGDGTAGWMPVAGDWDGNGADGIGLYKNGTWLLAGSLVNPVGTMQNIGYGPNQAGWLPVAGDWNSDGIDTIGLYKDGLWRIRLSSNTSGDEIAVFFGQAGDIPLVIVEGEVEGWAIFGMSIESPELPPVVEPTVDVSPVEPEAEITPVEPEPEITPEATEEPQ